MEPESSLPDSQVPATCLYPEPARSILILFFHLRLGLPSGAEHPTATNLIPSYQAVVSQDFENVGQMCVPQAGFGTDIPLCKRVGGNQYRLWQCCRFHFHVVGFTFIGYVLLNTMCSIERWWSETPMKNQSADSPAENRNVYLLVRLKS